MEIIIVIVLVAALAWLLFRFSREAHDSAESVIADAWRIVLSDPKYAQRRPLEERKFIAEREAKRLAEAAREKSGN